MLWLSLRLRVTSSSLRAVKASQEQLDQMKAFLRTVHTGKAPNHAKATLPPMPLSWEDPDALALVPLGAPEHRHPDPSECSREMDELEGFFFMGDEGPSAELESFFDFGSSVSSLTRLQKDCLRMLD